MARWHKLEKTAPLQTRQGCIDKMVHIWPSRFPPDDALAKELGQRLVFLFKDELLNLMASKNRAQTAPKAADPETEVPRSGKRKRTVGKK